MRPALAVLAVLLVLAVAPPARAATTTVSCTLVPHGSFAGVNTGCSVTIPPSPSFTATITWTLLNVDAFEIDMTGPGGETHAYACGMAAVTSVCAITPTTVTTGTWTITARGVTSDPAGFVVFGGADSYARLDVSYVS